MKRNYIFVVFFILLSLLFGCQGNGVGVSGSDEKPIKIGFMICNSRSESKERFEPIAAYLSEKIGRKFEPVLIDTYKFEEYVRDKKLDFTHTNSMLAISYNENYGLKLLTVDKRGRQGHRDSGVIITRKDSGIKNFDDMRGKTMVFGPALAPFGYMAQYYLMLTNGLDPEVDLSYYAIPGGSYKHEKVIYSVLFGRYDVGAVPRLDVDEMAEEGKINLDDFYIIAESIPMPYCTVGAMPDVDPALVQKVKETLLNLKQDETVLIDGEVLKVLDRAWLQGFVEADDSEFDLIRERLKRNNMEPYKKY
jgi:ABC-type phosphate/phosphonate transport system substrate-binding protein